MICFEIPGPPVGKARPRVVNGHAYTPQKTRDYEQWVRMAYLQQVGNEKLTGPIGMEVQAGFGVQKSDTKKNKQAKLAGAIKPIIKPDADNILKAVADALNGLAYDDDSQIVEATVRKVYAEQPYVGVALHEVGKEIKHGQMD